MKNATPRRMGKCFVFLYFMVAAWVSAWAQEGTFINTPSSVTLETGDTFSVRLDVQTGGLPIDGAEVHLDFDPNVLQVSNVTVLTTELPIPIVPGSFDNVLGQIDYVRGSFGPFPTEDFDFIEIDFQAIGSGNTVITYNSVFPRKTNMTSGGFSVLASPADIPVSIASQNENPMASFTANPTSGTAELEVNVDASASFDPDGVQGGVLEYTWAFGDGNTAIGVTADNTYVVPNTYTITLTVTDQDGGIGTATQNIIVNGISIPTYTITATPGPNGTIDPESATVDEGGSQLFTITPDSGFEVADVSVNGTSVGAVTSYELTNVQADSQIAASFNAVNADSTPEMTLDGTATVDEGGNVSVPLSITDTDGDALTVTITSVSSEPQELQSNNNEAQVDSFPIDASGFLTENVTTDNGGQYSSNLVFAPSFGDGGSNGDGNSVYTITVSVSDEDGNSIDQTLDLTVNDVHQFISENLATIIQAESYDNQGPANPGSGNNGIGVEDNTPGGVVNIGFTTNGDFAEYLIDVETAGTYSFDFSVAKGGGSLGTMTVNGGPASISVNGTGGWQTYVSANATVVLPAGQQTLRFDWSGPSNYYFNMDYLEVSFLGGTNNPPTIDTVTDLEVDEGEMVSINVQVDDDGVSPPSVSLEIFDKSEPGGTNNPFTPATTISGYTFVDNGGGTYTLSWDTESTEGRSYEARVTADDGVNPAVVATFAIDVAQDITGSILARTFSSPLPWYGNSPQSPFTVSIEGVGNIGYIDNNDFVEYLIDVPAAGVYNLRINASKGVGNSGLLTVSEENGAGFSELGTITVIENGWASYSDYMTPVTFTNAGLQTLRLDFSGGMNISEFEFTSLTGNTPPVVDILSPTDGLSVEEGTAVEFTATAMDTQHGDVAANLVWNSDIDGDFGTGATVNIATLSVGTHTITAIAIDNDPTTPLSGSASITVSIYNTAPACDVRFRVNAGGALFANSTGDFEADQAVALANGSAETGSPSPYLDLTVPAVDKTYGATGAITNTTGYPNMLFQTERYSDAANPDNMQWAFPTGNGIYDVKILFNENWSGEINEPRVFDVEIEGEIALDDYRPSGPSGADVNVAKVETYLATVTDGVLNIDFIKGSQNPAVKGFDICFVGPVSDSDPVVSITEPLDGATIGRNEPTAFSGTATDVEDDDAILTAALTWNSPTEPNFTGTGGTFTDQLIVPGPHTIRATATDNDGNTVTESITVTVSAPVVAFTAPLEGAVLASTDVSFTWSAENMLLSSPFDEHFHFYVNPVDPDNPDYENRISTASNTGFLVWDLGEAEGVIEGENTVVIVAAGSLHEEFTNPEARDVVSFTVCSTPIVTGPTTYPEGAGGVTLDAGPDYASYLWSPNGETTQTITVLAGTYSVTVTGANGCEGTSIGIVVTEEDDMTPPEVLCQDIDVQLDATGTASITAGAIDNGSNDASGIADLSIDIPSFDCSNIGPNTVTLTVTDNNGNFDSCTATVTVADVMAPVISCPANIEINSASSQVLQITPATATDNCAAGIDVTFERSDNPALGLDDPFPQGITTVQWTATDMSGNTDICLQTIRITLQQSTGNDILAFSVGGQVGPGTIDSNAGTVNLSVAFGTDVTALSPFIAISQLATISPDSGETQDFTTPVAYTVTAEDGSTREWTVDVNVEDEVEPSVLSVTGFTLVRADTDEDLFPLTDGMVIDVNALPTLFLDVRADATDDVESVKLQLGGTTNRTGTESFAPYALYQDAPTGNYLGNNFVTGSYTLTGTPYSGNGADQGTGLTIAFEMVDGDPDCLGVEVEIGTLTDPSTCEDADGSIVLRVSGTTGDLDYDWGHDANLESATAMGLSAGSYSVTVTDSNGCTKTVTAVLEKPIGPTVTLSPFAPVIETDAPFPLTGGNPVGGTYGGTGVDANGIFDPSIGAGTYTITYTYIDSNTGCGEGTAMRTITVTAPLNDTELTVINANTDLPLYALVNGLVIQKSDIGNTPLSIVYEPGTNTGQVKLELTGPISKNTYEGVAPYSLFGDIGVDILGRVFPVGEYTLMVNPSNGSAITVDFEITDIDPLCEGFDVTLQSADDPTVCGGTNGNLALSITGGSAPFSFEWSHEESLNSATVSGLSAGSYTVTVTDGNSCSETLTLTLNEPQPPTVSLASFENVDDQALAFALTGGAPAGGTYSGTGVDANGRFDPSVGAGVYIITYSYTDPSTGCTGLATETLRVTSPLEESELTVVDADTDDPLYALVDGLVIQKSDIGNTPLGIIYEPGTNPSTVRFTLTGPLTRSYIEGKAPYSLYGDIGVDIQGQIFPEGDYTLVINPSNAPAITVHFRVLQNVSATAKTVGSMKLFPNPADVSTTVSFKEPVQLTRFYVYDVTGRLVRTIAAESAEKLESTDLDVYDLPIGAYFIRTTDTTGKGFQQRLIIEK